MKRAGKLAGGAAALLLLTMLSAAPASAQLVGFGGGDGEDMMTQMAPMLNMMKAKLGKRRFAMLMRTMGPMMTRMMQGRGLGGMGGFGGMGGYPGGYMPGGYTPGGYGMGGYDMGTPDIGSIMSMIGPMMRMANVGGHKLRHWHHRRKVK